MYFKNKYESIRYPIVDKPNKLGLRESQSGAVHAIASHFTLKNSSAIVVMPTGSGKTVVLMMSAYLLRAKRALVVTPSRLVRDQIFENFSSLNTLKEIGVLKKSCSNPEVKEVTNKLTNIEDWNSLRKFDVVVGTPNSISPAITDVVEPPEDLFDLILVDEAHHSPAKTWNELLQSFPNAKKILFTATPFRRDKKEIEGSPIYNYPLSKAFKDRIFGKIKYIPVVLNNEPSDIAIAKKAEEVFQDDKSQGLNHYLMVRTDSKKRANELKDIYKEHTNLKLSVIHSGHSLKHIKKSIKKLRDRELDGVICVDMMGEGFDFPELKIAAIHTPHKSLAVTLQFIGRFARTNAENIGTAKFIAVPSEIEIEGRKLYEEDATWDEIITNLSETRVEEEAKISEQISTFKQVSDRNYDYKDISLHSLHPYFHVKIYRVDTDANVDLQASITLPDTLEIVHLEISDSLNSVVFSTREMKLPRWTYSEEFTNVEHDLFIVYFDTNSHLLFINASRKSTNLYEQIVKSFTKGNHSILPQAKVNSVLATLSNYEFFNIGMRRRALNPNAETYRISAGSSTQNAIDPTDGRMYTRGHVYCSADDSEGKKVNIGYSSAGKVWSNRAEKIPGFINWAKLLASRINNNKNFATGSPIDQLSLGEEINKFPDNVIAAYWHCDTYTKNRALIGLPDNIGEIQLMEVDLSIDTINSQNGIVQLELNYKDIDIIINHFLSDGSLVFESIKGNSEHISVSVNRENIPLLDYLRDYPPMIFLSDFSLISHGQLHEINETLEPFDANQINIIDWKGAGVDITNECKIPNTNGQSIQDYLKSYLPNQQNQIVFFDHRSGEMADFVTFNLKSTSLTIQLYHCKGSHTLKPGSRINDAYEVAGQVVKSIIWLKSLQSLQARITKREDTGSVYLKGNRQQLEKIIKQANNIQLKFKIVLVQPGISQSKLKENVATVLAAADRFIVENNCEKLVIWGSV